MAFNWEDPRPIPKMTVDNQKCNVPLTCKKCLELCPQAVFALITLKYVKYVETNINEPYAYAVRPMHRDKCTGCMECVNACPRDAITVQFGEGEVK
ncbi:4Fe-4S dicluster domain-containing protein [Desulfallas sp. Bu1-1]|jgi:ferredoxin|uniref:ATP-binding protein n=1 Tax=Desulfallas sp. Bu1-1 TaxID=2787620 RepID=UPI00189DC734|nr:4Fe-4S binding protein [Desulfallas sp. Bu1-1]MBF7082746.1 4Fe-4S dicluster domain-containing protein [Desulfallas sp. Bu1-1]